MVPSHSPNPIRAPDASTANPLILTESPSAKNLRSSPVDSFTGLVPCTASH